MNNIKLMYKMMEGMVELEYPVVFKGGMLLNNIMVNDGFRETYRLTKDIDLDWEEQIDSKELLDKIKVAVDRLDIDNVEVVNNRQATEGRSAGFQIKSNGVMLFSMDISIRENNFKREYYNKEIGFKFIGSCIEKICVDKIGTISDRKIYKRVKDLYDIYLLSKIEGIRLNSIREIINISNKKIGEFIEYIEHRETTEDAYNRLGSIYNKPTFNMIIETIDIFLKPFIDYNEFESNCIWDVNSNSWHI